MTLRTVIIFYDLYLIHKAEKGALTVVLPQLQQHTFFLSCLGCGDQLLVKSLWTVRNGRMRAEKSQGPTYEGMDRGGGRRRQSRPEFFYFFDFLVTGRPLTTLALKN